MNELATEKNYRFLNHVEKIGNKLPHPFIMFVYLCLIIMAISSICSLTGVSAVNPATGETVVVQNLFSKAGLQWILTNMIKNFTGFAPLGIVLVITLGTGLAEECGFFFTFLKQVMTGVPGALITAAIVLCGILGNIASDAAFVFLPPIGALIFLSVGRHPLAGLAAGYAGVGAGFTANLLITPQDANLAGITNAAVALINPDLAINPAANWYFLIASTIVLTILGTLITDKLVEPRLGKYAPEGGEEQVAGITALEKRGLRNAGFATLAYLALIFLCVVPQNGILRGADGSILKSPFMSGLIPIIFFLFLVISLAYGKTVGTIQSSKDVPRLMGVAIQKLSGFIVLCFVIGQFVAFFNWSNLGTILAVNGAELLSNIGFTGTPLIICFILFTAFINLFIGSGQAKWAILAPIFIPMLTLLDYSPAFIQMAYRIGDSATNVISPLFTYVAILLAYVQKYRKDAGIGTLMSLMMPYALIFLAAWIVLLLLWMVAGLPLGPGAAIMLG